MGNTQITINPTIKNTLDYNTFIRIVHESINMNCEDIIKTHKKLMKKIDPSGICKCEYGEKFMLNILNYDFGYCFVKETPDELLKFFNSKHTSNYLKQLINKYNNNQSLVVSTLVNSDKDLKDFTEEELYLIYESLDKIGLGEMIIALAFKLDSQGAINFLNNKINPIRLIKRIIYTSGLSARPEYYSGRGARLSDLNGKMLSSIYNKLSRVDQNKGLSMAIMTLNMNTLGATEFLESLYTLVYNDYNLENTILSTNNYSLGNSHNKEREDNAISIYAASLGIFRWNETSEIKKEFKELLPKETILELQQNTTNYQKRRVR